MRLKGSKWKGRNRGSSEHISSKRKTWLSAGVPDQSNKMDVGRRLGFPWYHAPMYQEARAQKWRKT